MTKNVYVLHGITGMYIITKFQLLWTIYLMVVPDIIMKLKKILLLSDIIAIIMLKCNVLFA